jgi:hypothetical protein
MKPKREVEPPLSYPPELSIRPPKSFPANGPQRMLARRSIGWDPYEVWRTRVKADRDPVEGDTLDSVG